MTRGVLDDQILQGCGEKSSHTLRSVQNHTSQARWDFRTIHQYAFDEHTGASLHQWRGGFLEIRLGLELLILTRTGKLDFHPIVPNGDERGGDVVAVSMAVPGAVWNKKSGGMF